MKTDWYSCDGNGGDSSATSPREYSRAANETAAPTLSRRRLLGGMGLGALAFAARSKSALAEVAFHPEGGERPHDVLVTIFLRGGADCLNIVVPHGDDAYYRNRPTIGIAAPKSGKGGAADRALDLDGFFGLHPALSPLHVMYGEGAISFVHACGSGDGTRSHFEAMAAMERGLRDDRGSGASNGWIARHLASTRGSDSPLRAVAFGGVMPDSLRGATNASALDSLADFRLQTSAKNDARGDEAHLRRALLELYGGKDEVSHAGRQTLDVLKTLNKMAPENYRPAHGAAYPEGDLGNGLKQVACLIKGEVGLEVACLDSVGWDTHFAQASTNGAMATLMETLGKSLAAFSRDMGAEMKRTTVVVMTEFGRRLQENSSLGTDHGRAGAMMLLGGGIRGGRVFARWPGLEDHQLQPPGDLRVTTDYRDVLSEIVSRRLRNDNLASVFPKYAPRFVGVTV